VEGQRFRRFDYDAITKRDKLNLDIFWLKDDSLDDPDYCRRPKRLRRRLSRATCGKAPKPAGY
jgi:type I restriction enzyme M protein